MMIDLFYTIWHGIVSVAEAAPSFAHDTVPTAEEPGFKFTINLGQVVQIIGIGIPFLLYINKMSVRHALMDQNMKTLNSAVASLQADMKTMSLAMAQIPTIVRTSHSNHAMISALVGHRVNKIQDNKDEPDITAEYLDGLSDKLREMGKD